MCHCNNYLMDEDVTQGFWHETDMLAVLMHFCF